MSTVKLRRGRILRSDRQKIEQILTPELIEHLSPNARRVCAMTFTKIALCDGRYALISDKWIMRSAKIAYSDIPSARKELIDMGLITFEDGRDPADTPEQVQHLIRWIADQPNQD